MQQIRGHDAALAVLHDPGFIVPPVPPGTHGIAWLRSAVGRFSSGDEYARRRALSVGVLDDIPLEALRHTGTRHPVAVLAVALGVTEHDLADVVDRVRDVAQAYQPGTGDEARADAAVNQLVACFGGVQDEATAARIGALVQACDATAILIDRTRHASLDEVLRDQPPVPFTKRQAVTRTTVGDVTVEAGETVQIELAGELAFGAGPRACPGRAHALALVEGASS
ncbi:hypothetical protein AB0H43_20290 [Hamadaea sp. NPDC050747]|uniref:hypothetical protein n=1 Tax=Hamadaea sp. NPDC050747 TaxID=3155789 RepID=UPI003406C2EB